MRVAPDGTPLSSCSSPMQKRVNCLFRINRSPTKYLIDLTCRIDVVVAYFPCSSTQCSIRFDRHQSHASHKKIQTVQEDLGDCWLFLRSSEV